jgi:hypothetical protein
MQKELVVSSVEEESLHFSKEIDEIHERNPAF